MQYCGFSYNNMSVSGNNVQLRLQNNELSSNNNDNPRQAEQVSLLTCISEHNNNELICNLVKKE